ncbi:MAG: amino acid permease [Nanobdellota archaeon]
MTGEVKRDVGFMPIFLITLNAIFASSLTYLPGVAVQEMGGRSLVAWVFIFAIGIYVAMGLAELVTLFPDAGDLYVYAKEAFGHFTAFLVGWVSWLGGNLTASLGVVWALEYFYPKATFMSYVWELGIALVIIFLLNLAVYMGMTLKRMLLAFFSVITLVVLFIQILPLFVNLSSVFGQGGPITKFTLQPIIDSFTSQAVNPVLLFATAFIIAEGIMGMEIITFLSEQAKSRKTIPKALLSAISVAAFFTILYVFGSLGILPIGEYASSLLPHKEIIHMLWSGTVSTFIFVGTALMILSPAIVWALVGPNLLKSLGKDKLILRHLSELHPRFKTPYKGIIFQGVVISIFTVFMFLLYMNNHHDPYKLVHEVFIILALLTLSVTMLTIPVFRKKYKNFRREFKLPFGEIGPIMLVMIFIVMGVSYAIVTGTVNIFSMAGSLVVLGVPVYFLIELYYDPTAIIKVNDSFAHLALFTESITVPKNVRKRIFDILSDVRGKKVLEYGCNIGTITLMLARLVGPRGEVYATDISMKHLKITHNRVKKQKKKLKDYKHPQLYILHDENQMTRIHPSIPYADAVISMGMLGYVQDIKNVLDDIYNILPDGGELCFVEFGDFFKVIPNVEWLSNNARIEKIFRESGFSVRVIREEGTFWNYIYVYGIKSKEDVPFI